MANFFAYKIVLFYAVILLPCISAQRRKGCSFYKRPISGTITQLQENFVNCWGQDVESGQSELVILLDTSGSMAFGMGTYNNERMNGYEVAKAFIKSLLSEVRIAFNATRIALGTFSTRHKVRINYILEPSYANQKCKFNNDFQKIELDGELTNLKGTLNDAYNIFRQLDSNPLKHHRRSRSNKVVILLSDGMGNVVDDPSYRSGYKRSSAGADATIEALKLKQTGYVEVYTVAVTDASDTNMLKKIATDSSNFLFAKDFTELANFAFNIRGDPYEKDYETSFVDPSLCDQCDRNAECGCNLRSGNYKCVCRRGWFGTAGFDKSKTTCHECTKDTYGDKRGYLYGCKKCPQNSVTVVGRPALSIKDCICDKGFTGNPFYGEPCKPKPCLPAPDINFGFIRNSKVCHQSTYKTKCYYECNSGYEMSSHQNFIECMETGTWSYPLPSCLLISCNASWFGKVDNHFTVQCNKLMDSTTNTYPSGTSCIFTCDASYYQYKGANELACLSSGKWDDFLLDCRISTCPVVPKLSEKIKVHDPNFDCFTSTLKVNDRCEFWCPQGYELVGRQIFECLPSNGPIGKWNVDTSKRSNVPVCVDIERPKFDDSDRCDLGIDIKRTTEKGKMYAAINFEDIGVSDNSGETVNVICTTDDGFCEYEMGKVYQIDIVSGMSIKFNATDSAGNTQLCRFQITVEDLEKPVLVSCPDRIVKKTSKQTEVVYWEEPEYIDNCGEYPDCNLKIDSTPKGNSFSKGVSYTVQYTAIDPSNNLNDDCKFDVKILGYEGCEEVVPPRNGLVTKFDNLFKPACRKGSYPTSEMGLFYMCQGGKWNSPLGGTYPLPDCLKKNPPSGMAQGVFATLEFEGDCSGKATQEQVKQNFKDSNLCFACTVESIEVFCGGTHLLNRRTRRNLRQLTIKASVVVNVPKEQVQKDVDGSMRRLKQKLITTVPDFIWAVKNFKNWRSLNKYLFRLSSISQQGIPEEVCFDIADVQNNTEPLDRRCYVCGVGTFKNQTTNECQACPKGTYQPKPGQLSCLSCPSGFSTNGADVKDFTSCKEMCLPGTYSQNGFSPCNLCGKGSYSDVPQSTTCKKCPSGTFTLKFGTASIRECGTSCQPGSFSSNGVEPCTRCPKGFYQNLVSQLKCNACPYLKSTPGIGSSSLSSCISIDDCVSSPCMNSGHCIDLRDNFRCECKEGYWGKQCELEVDECALQPCSNNATCLDKFGTYTCICKPGMGGENCDQVIKKCTAKTCSGQGVCLDLSDQRTKCVCTDDYTGEFCEAKVDPCYPNPCTDVGFCEPKGKDFNCRCLKGFYGETCQNKVNFCDPGPCKNNATCIDGITGFMCQCTVGYTGSQCEILIDMCNHKKCHNKGVCNSKTADVECKCSPGYSGKQCETKESNNFDFSFQTRVSPSFSFVHGRENLNEFTIAFWMRTSDKENIGTPISYSVFHNSIVHDNALVLTDYRNFNLVINNKTQPLDFQANDGEWHHITVMWTNYDGSWQVYKDGMLHRNSKGPFQKREFIRKGGIFVIGEEQDDLGGDFTPAESFFGDLSQLNIWSMVLSADKIYNLASVCHHYKGDVVAWEDFAPQTHGGVIKTTPSLVCNFQNLLRGFQYLQDHDLPVSVKSTSTIAAISGSVENCTKHCNSLPQCRSFASNSQQCVFYSTSPLVQNLPAEIKYNTDLYSSSCVKSLGMSNGAIPNQRITASSTKGVAYPHLARLFNHPKQNEMVAFWQPQDNVPAYLQIQLGKFTRVTGIATQGHIDRNVMEFATKLSIEYRTRSMHIVTYLKSFAMNTAPVEIVRREVNIVTDLIRLHVSHDDKSKRVALRVELYGCALNPQGTPPTKPDVNQCSSQSCLNSATCVDLYATFKCACLDGFYGQRCEYSVCDANDLDVPLNGRVIQQPNYALYSCNKGYQLVGQAKVDCVNGRYEIKSKTMCRDVNECEEGRCTDGCENLNGSYRCFCPLGKVQDRRNPRLCFDENECVGNTGCELSCSNTMGSFSCRCHTGYYHEPGQRICRDFNECASPATNNCDQLCHNILGSYTCSCSPGYTLNHDGRSCSLKKCSTLGHPVNGHCSVAQNKAVCTCSPGFKLDGANTRWCQPDSTWSGVQPKCTPVTCVPRHAPENSKILENTGHHYGARFKITCKLGYKLFGDQMQVCGENGWSGTSPLCAVETCPRFNVVNGAMLGVATITGSVVQIVCNEGYRLVQKHLRFRTCGSNKQWSGGNHLKIQCKRINCGTVHQMGVERHVYVNGTSYGSLVRCSCPHSYCLSGDTVRRCRSDGQWSGRTPQCLKNSCCEPRYPKQATLYSNGRFYPGDPVYIKCNVGYTRSGDEFRECQKNLRWSGSETKCTVVDCGSPMTYGGLPNGRNHGNTSTMYLSRSRFFCDPGYLITGSRERVCQANGKWSGKPPSCLSSPRGGHIRSKSGVLKCFGGMVCHWLIQVTQGKKIMVNFTTFNIGNDDKTEIYDGETFTPYMAFSKGFEPRPFTSSGHFIRIISAGFVQFTYQETNCGGLLNGKRGVINSPNYPNVYPPNSDCYWTIHRPYNRVQLRFLDFKLQSRHVDHVSVYEGPFIGTRSFLYRRYGNGIPWLNKDWADRWYWVHFKSDGYYQEKGFKAVYSIYEPRVF